MGFRTDGRHSLSCRASAPLAVLITRQAMRLPYNLRMRRSAALQEFEGFIVAFALEKVGELRIDRFRQRGDKIVELF